MQNESQNIEYKESWRDEYIKWICGFANAQGGIIYIGVTDEKIVCGIPDAKKMLEDIPNKVRDLLGIIVDVNLHASDGKEYLEIVTEPSNVPISYKGQYHYRTGSTKQELKGVALQQFILKKMGKQWDDVAHETATLDCIDNKAIAYFVKKGIASGRLPKEIENEATEHVLENLHLLTEEGKLKNAAILLFAKDPLRYFTGIQFKIGRFGVDETDLMFQDEIEGNILQMADKVVNTLKSMYLKSLIHYEGMQRIESLEIPEDALRELLYNAIIHKQYPGYPILMHVYEDHIELWNEGQLPVGYTIETLLTKHSSKPRNMNIANVFNKAGFIEAWGRGIGKVIDGFRKAGLPLPTIAERDGGLVINLFRSNGEKRDLGRDCGSDLGSVFGSDLSERQKNILNLLIKDGTQTAESFSKALGVTKRTIETDLSFLRKNGYIDKTTKDNRSPWIVLKIK